MTEAYIRCNGRCSRATARLIEDIAHWLGVPWWVILVIVVVVILVAIALAAYIGRRRLYRKPRAPLRARRRRW